MSLERKSTQASSQEASNWQSAAADVGYATPTYANSQGTQGGGGESSISVPKYFSPDGDGQNDIAEIAYNYSQPNALANVRILDITGRTIKKLVNNGLMGATGTWKWDGKNDSGQPVAMGNYIVVAEIFTLQGNTKIFKSLLVVTKRVR